MAAAPIIAPKRQKSVSASRLQAASPRNPDASEIPGAPAPGPGGGADDPSPSSSLSDLPGGGPAPAPGLFHFSPEQGEKLARWLDREANWARGCLRAGMRLPVKPDRADRPWRALLSPVVLDAMDACEAARLWAPEDGA